MKNKLLYTLLFAMSISLFACKKDFLNLVPETSLSNATFYQTTQQFQQALSAAYVPLRTIVHIGFYEDEMRSDNTFFTIYFANRGLSSVEALPEFLVKPTSSAEPNSPGNRWGNDYSGISMINTILDQLPKATSVPEGVKDSISGEAKFLRAYYYYDLVQHYGGVPLQLTQVGDAEASFQPRNTVAEVYDQIVKDLTESISVLTVPESFPQSGRATKGAAKMLLAYAYMSMPTKDYAKAESALRDVTKMHYALLPKYSDVFNPENKNSSESIFEVQYMADLVSGQQSDFTWIFMPKTTNSEFLAGFHDGSMNIFSGWNVPTQEMVDSYESGDLRLPASIAVVEGTISGVEDFTAKSIKSPVGFKPTAGLDYRYMIKKYFHPPYTIAWNTPDDFPVFRYSGTLLLLAECLVDQNRSGEALPYLNQVRARAGLPPLSVATSENVANEMRHELAFENHRWTDLIRRGKAIEVVTEKGKRLKKLYGWLLPSTFNVTKEKLISPIPFREMQINKELTQNAGY